MFLKYIYIGCFLITCYVGLGSCQKEFLDKKPSTDLIVPSTLDDCQRLMDSYEKMNDNPLLGEVSSDNYYLASEAAWGALPIEERNAYIWKPDIYEGTEKISDWNKPYNQVFVANVVLEAVEKIPQTGNNKEDWKRMKGWALFLRAHAFFNLAQLFAPVYDSVSAANDLGIPIRLRPGVDESSNRASVQQTYDQIIQDLKVAVELLPSQLPATNRNRPSKAAALGLLARVYLNVRDYDHALQYAEDCLKVHDVLLDFNSLPATTPFTLNHNEAIYQCLMGAGQLIFMSVFSQNAHIDTLLLKTYGTGDLRKEVFFKSMPGYTMINYSYSARTEAFGGIATDEIYLIKAECLARKLRIKDSMEVLNKLLIKRFRPENYIPAIAGTYPEALEIILAERRKELAFRGLRWQDLRRLNKEGFNIHIKRKLNGQYYELSPNSSLYVLPIPPDEIRLSGIAQNKR